MKISKISASFPADIETVWQVVTDNEHSSWRSDLSKVEIIDDIHFVEYAKNGFPTSFTITEKLPFELYAFAIENKNMTGTWQGRFYTGTDGETCIEFIEELTFKNPVLKVICMFMNVKKIQETYIRDLRNHLMSRGGTGNG